MTYAEKLSARIRQTGSALCVGLDPRVERINPSNLAKANNNIIQALETEIITTIEAVSEQTAAFKPNMAYFEALGIAGLQLLERSIKRIPKEIPIILDAKRSDIGETQKYYAKSYFELMDVDAVTLNPFMGYDSIEPFLDYQGKGIYLLAVTSNSGSMDIQRRQVGEKYVYEWVGEMATRAETEQRATSVGLVVGLTNAGDSEVLQRLPDVPLLMPGLGAQGGAVDVLKEQKFQAANLINVSRGIAYPPQGTTQIQAAQQFSKQIAEGFNL